MSLVVLVLVSLQRLSELLIARRNTAALLAKGGIETGAAHYPVMVALHASWLVGLWWFGWNQIVHMVALVPYIILQFGRVWVLATLGRRWTTRIISVSGEELVARGPYRFLRHPNYAIVALEIPLLPLAFGLPTYALVFGLLNLAMLAWRISAEEKAIAPENKVPCSPSDSSANKLGERVG
jgi:methyltransferase